MSNNRRVLNVTRGFTMKFKQALKAVEECACDWTDRTQTAVRDLTLAESIQKRHEIAKLRAPLDTPELHGLTWDPPAGERSFTFLHERRVLLAQAREYAAQF